MEERVPGVQSGFSTEDREISLVKIQKQLSLVFASVPELGNATIVPKRFVTNSNNDNDCYFHSIGFLLGGLSNFMVKENLLTLWDTAEGLHWLKIHADNNRIRLDDIKKRLHSYDGALGVYEETYSPLVEKYYNVKVVLYSIIDDKLSKVIMSKTCKSRVNDDPYIRILNICLVHKFKAFMPIIVNKLEFSVSSHSSQINIDEENKDHKNHNLLSVVPGMSSTSAFGCPNCTEQVIIYIYIVM